ncbi:hypothetical protein F5I97DRAFT_1847484 [Phlebopus sp. FC_14]|nr:hypothetical protein F5I97DRAFT_1847484 [Phlebopus sp. FC_14]
MAVPSWMKVDPAIERWNRMREDAYKHFRFTPQNLLFAFSGFVLVPGAMYYLASQTHLKYRWTGKRKDEALTQV